MDFAPSPPKKGPGFAYAVREFQAETTPAEREVLAAESIAKLAAHINAEDVNDAVNEIAALAIERVAHERESGPDFAILVATRSSIMEAASSLRPDSAFDFVLAAEVRPKEMPSEHLWSGFRRALIAAATGMDSGTLKLDKELEQWFLNTILGANPEPDLDEEEYVSPIKPDLLLQDNVAGAIVVGEVVISVAGLRGQNNKEAAEAIAIYALSAANERLRSENWPPSPHN